MIFLLCLITFTFLTIKVNATYPQNNARTTTLKRLGCLPGQYYVNGNCEYCEAGTYSPGSDDSVCYNCPNLQYSLGSASQCKQCDSSCLSCNPKNGLCTSCQPGKGFYATSSKCSSCQP
ncbi:hypothetical protein EIN_142340, partial [Entamoeba invadens IP1]